MLEHSSGSDVNHVRYHTWKIRGCFYVPLHFARYPFDIQSMLFQFQIAHLPEGCQSVSVHTQNFSTLPTNCSLYGWNCLEHAFKCEERPNSQNDTREVTISWTVPIQRQHEMYLYKHFLVHFMMTLAAFTSYGIGKQDIPTRFQNLFTLLITTVGFQAAISSTLPPVSTFTYFDYYFLISVITNICIIVQTMIFVLTTHEQFHQFDNYFGIAFFAFWLASHIVYIVHIKHYMKHQREKIKATSSVS